MLLLLLVVLLALPVLLGLVPNADSTAARRRVVWCALAGLFVGVLRSAFAVVTSPDAPLSARTLLLPLWGALLGVGAGAAGALGQRVVAERRGRIQDRDLRANDR